MKRLAFVNAKRKNPDLGVGGRGMKGGSSLGRRRDCGKAGWTGHVGMILWEMGGRGSSDGPPLGEIRGEGVC